MNGAVDKWLYYSDNANNETCYFHTEFNSISKDGLKAVSEAWKGSQRVLLIVERWIEQTARQDKLEEAREQYNTLCDDLTTWTPKISAREGLLDKSLLQEPLMLCHTHSGIAGVYRMRSFATAATNVSAMLCACPTERSRSFAEIQSTFLADYYQPLLP